MYNSMYEKEIKGEKRVDSFYSEKACDDIIGRPREEEEKRR